MTDENNIKETIIHDMDVMKVEEKDGNLSNEEAVDPNNFADPTISKKKLKRLAKKEKWNAKKRRRKEENLRRKKGIIDDVENESDANDEDETKVEGQEIVPKEPQQLSERNLQRKQEFLDRLKNGSTILVDCEWEEHLTDKEIKSLIQQLLYCFGANKRAATPAHFVLSGVEPGGKQHSALKKLAGFDDWIGFRCESEPYTSLYEPEQLIYLSSDATEILEEIEKDKVYIIGGIVDRNRLKGSTHQKALSQDIRTVRLPIQEHRSMGTYSSVLTVNHVFTILLEFQATKDWNIALEKGIPQRKH